MYNPRRDGETWTDRFRFPDNLFATPRSSQNHLRAWTIAEGCTYGYACELHCRRLAYTLIGGCTIPCEFKLSCGHICPSSVRNIFSTLVYFLIFLQLPSAIRTSTTTRARDVTRSAHAWSVHVCILASDFVMNLVAIASSRSPT